jgi:peptide deformylase
MAIVPVLIYPDPRLKQISERVESHDDAEITKIIEDLVETMYSSPGCVGIAAPQIGAMKRIMVIDASRNAKNFPNQGKMILINPVIETQEGEVIAREGCLSLPDLTANVKRAETITVSATSTDGSPLHVETSGFEARVILHEYDHLDGILFLDRVASLKTDVFRRKRYNAPTHSS